MTPFSFLVQPLEVTTGNRLSITMPFYKFTFSLGSDLHETNVYKELNLLRKIIPKELSAPLILKFIF